MLSGQMLSGYDDFKLASLSVATKRITVMIQTVRKSENSVICIVKLKHKKDGVLREVENGIQSEWNGASFKALSANTEEESLGPILT